MAGDTSESRNTAAAEFGPLDELTRWEDSGGYWRVLTRTASGVVISLLRCDGGEEMARLTSSDPRLLAYVEDRLGNE